MKEVKFVGKAVMPVEELELHEIAHENGWVTGNLIQGAQPFIVGGIVDGGEDYINHEFFVQVVPGTERIFTGLKDKNGREIYEGDIVEQLSERTYESVIGIVKFVDGSYLLEFLSGHDGCYLFDEVAYNEVLGNIYEHPHLLDGREVQ